MSGLVFQFCEGFERAMAQSVRGSAVHWWREIFAPVAKDMKK
jgi:hypothetical protein